MLNQLGDMHSRVRETIAELAGILAQAEVDLQALAKARMKLTRLTGQWRTLVQCSLLPGLNQVAPDPASQLAELRREAADFAVMKSNHIARWSARATETDLAGYKQASVKMRRSLLARIDLEAAILYPLLEAKAAEGMRAQP